MVAAQSVTLCWFIASGISITALYNGGGREEEKVVREERRAAFRHIFCPLWLVTTYGSSLGPDEEEVGIIEDLRSQEIISKAGNACEQIKCKALKIIANSQDSCTKSVTVDQSQRKHRWLKTRWCSRKNYNFICRYTKKNKNKKPKPSLLYITAPSMFNSQPGLTFVEFKFLYHPHISHLAPVLLSNKGIYAKI